MKTSIIMPTYYRPEQLLRNLASLYESTDGLDIEIVAVFEQDTTALEAVKAMPNAIVTHHADWRGSMANWNIGAGLATGDLLVLGADDISWRDRWLHNAIAHMEEASTCYVGLNDLMWDGWTQHVTHWAITRQGIIDYCGGCLMPPAYKTTWGDNEIGARMKRAGQFTWCEDAIVDHQHHGNNKARMDKAYMMVTRHVMPDELTFKAREAAGFLDDFEPVVFPLGEVVT